MRAGILRRTSPLLAGVCATGIWVATVSACPLCAKLDRTQSDFVEAADLVFLGELEREAEPSAKKSESARESSLRIVSVVKDHPIRQGRETLRIAPHIPSIPSASSRRLVFAKVRGRQVVATRTQQVFSDDLVNYLTEAGRVRGGPYRPKYAYFFQRLDSPHEDVARDAYKELSKAPFRELSQSAGSFDPVKLRRWIKSESTPSYLIGLSGMLLGICRQPEDYAFLQLMTDSPEPRVRFGLDGLLGGMVILDAAKASIRLTSIATDRSNDYVRRYSALNALQFLFDEFPRVAKAPILERLAPALEMPDVSDQVIDMLRNGAYWGSTDAVLKLASDARETKSPGGARRELRGAVVRYAIACPASQAKAFIAELRRRDPRIVAEAEQNLEFEKVIRGSAVRFDESRVAPIR